GSVRNEGAIDAAAGGYIVLLGSEVANAGSLRAERGTVALGAGSSASLTLAGNELIAFRVDGAAVGALAENTGLISAGGGQVLLSARAKDALLDTVINQRGIVEAQSLSERDGVIRLEGGDS